MKSKIRVEYDFDRIEPYLQLRIEGHDEDGGELADKTLKNMVEVANGSLMYIIYQDAGNCLPQIRVLNPARTPESELQFVIEKFEMFALQFFQETEIDNANSFFRALRAKVMVNAQVKDWPK